MADLLTQEAILQMIADKAKATGVDDFRLRIARRKTPGTVPEVIAQLEGARAENLTAPETWLPRLVGGGRFEILAYHSSDMNAFIGGPIITQLDGDPIKPSHDVLKALDWTGPSRMIYPQREKPKDDFTHIGGGGVSGSSFPMPAGRGAEGSPGAAIFDQAQARLAALEQQLTAKVDRLNQAERDIARREADVEVQAAKREAEAARREADARVQRLEAMVANRPTEKNGLDVTELIKALAPLALQVISSNQATQAAIAAANAKANADILAAITSKPAIDPQVLALISRDDGSSKMMEHMGDLMSASTTMTMNVLQMAVESGLAGGQRGSEESPVLKAVREGIRAFMALSARSQQAAASSKRAPAPQKQLQPQPQPQPQLAPQPAPAPAVEKGGAAAQDKAAEPSAFDKIVFRLLQKNGTPEDIARDLVEHIEDPSILEVIANPDVDFREIFLERLGDQWFDAPGNVEFLKEFMRSFGKQGVTAGLFPENVLEEIEKAIAEFDAEQPEQPE